MSTAAPSSPPLLSQIKTDLKTAMRAKDTNRYLPTASLLPCTTLTSHDSSLNVLRAIISDTNNASKTSSPILTDLQLLALIKKRAASARESAKEFAAADRADLVEKETSQAAVYDEYAAQVQTVTTEDITAAIQSTIETLQAQASKVDLGSVIKSVFGPEGQLNGKPAEKSEVAKVAKELVAKLQK